MAVVLAQDFSTARLSQALMDAMTFAGYVQTFVDETSENSGSVEKALDDLSDGSLSEAEANLEDAASAWRKLDDSIGELATMAAEVMDAVSAVINMFEVIQ